MKGAGGSLEILFLGTGSPASYEGRALSSFVVNGRYLFDAGPMALQQLKKAQVHPSDIQVILISHYHADHFFGLPLLLLEYWASGRENELRIIGPPGIEARTEALLDLAFPELPRREGGYRRRYIEVDDGVSGEAAGLQFEAFEVEHVPSLRCFGYRAVIGGRLLAYSGDSVLCPGLLRLVARADVMVLNCSSRGDPVHLAFGDLATVINYAPATATTIVSHVDGPPPAAGGPNVCIASDLEVFRF